MFHYFEFNFYYPAGGVDDLKGQFATLEECAALFEAGNADEGQAVVSIPAGLKLVCRWQRHAGVVSVEEASLLDRLVWEAA